MEYSLGTMEYRFMLLVWQNEPVSSMKLVHMCEQQFKWKKSTTFTALKRLQDKGFVENKNSVVTSLISQEEVMAEESRIVISETFMGSLPRFVAAFLGSNSISEEEAEEIKKLIDSIKE